jgi:predicted methyltransferase MtxX (methanogen marker protein 4)
MALSETLSATKTLSILKSSLGMKQLYRVALLEIDGTPFFLHLLELMKELVEGKIELVKGVGISNDLESM